MKWRTKEVTEKGENPYVSVDVVSDGSEAKVELQYMRQYVRQDTKHATFFTLDLGYLTADELACVGRTISRALSDMAMKHWDHLNALKDGVRDAL